MAAGGFRTFVAGEVLDEDDINNFLMQGVLVFADSTARDAAIGTPVEGQFAFLTDTDELTFYDSSSWVEYITLREAVVSGTTGAPTVTTYTDGGFSYTAYAFTGSGSITFSAPGYCEALVVGGGGYSATSSSGNSRTGGGAGGMIQTGRFLVEDKSYTVTVAAGSAGSWRDGGDSFFAGFSAIGGGAGVSTADGLRARGRKGGSGSGSATVNGNSDTVRGFGIAGQGNNGATLDRNNEAAGGGAGGPGSGSTPGAGLASSITGSSVTYAQGGGDSTTSRANSGNGGQGTGNGDSGIIVIRVRT